MHGFPTTALRATSSHEQTHTQPKHRCIPQCTPSGGCPTDKPPGVTATPSCVLTTQSGDKYCALTCTASASNASVPATLDAQCGKRASCKAATKGGLCTYDDVPKPPSSEHWVPIDSPTFQAQSVCLAVGFTADGVTGYAGAGSNDVGAQVQTGPFYAVCLCACVSVDVCAGVPFPCLMVCWWHGCNQCGGAHAGGYRYRSS